MTDADCLFCKIAAGDIPANIVASDDQFVAFRDINPQAPTHVLVVPRRHRREGLADRGYRVVLNTNAEAGQTVFHIHAHVLGGRAMLWPPG